MGTWPLRNVMKSFSSESPQCMLGCGTALWLASPAMTWSRWSAPARFVPSRLRNSAVRVTVPRPTPQP